MNRRRLTELNTLDCVLASTCLVVDEKGVAPRPIKVPVAKSVLSETAHVKLEESQHENVNASLLKSVTLTDIDDESLVLKPDHFGIRYYRPGTWNKACDYLVLTSFDGARYAVFIDLKTSIGTEPDCEGRLAFRGAAYDSGMIWQMLGADLLFDGLENAVYRTECHSAGKNTKRLSSHVQSLVQRQKTALAKYKRRYVILYQTVKLRGNGTAGGISTTAAGLSPNDASLESPVYAFKVTNGESVRLGELLSNIGGV
jgi:hypothetical protein